jgi:hypothetical protein
LIIVEQITFPFGPNAQTVIDDTHDAKSLDEIDQKLVALGVQHGRSGGTINSAELPDNLLRQMLARKPDDIFFLRSGANGVFFVVRSEEAKPLGGEAAINFARQALRSNLLQSEIGMASVAANLEVKYEGDYAKLMNQQKQQPNAAQ